MSRARRRLFVQSLETRNLMAGDVGFSGDIPVVGDWDGDGTDQIAAETRIVLGQDGDDLLIVNNGDGSDFVEGGEDDITVVGAGGNDFVSGGAGNDILISGDGNDIITGAGPGAGPHVSGGTINVNEESASGITAGEEGGGLWNDAFGTMTVKAVDAVMSEQGGGGVFNNGGTLNLR